MNVEIDLVTASEFRERVTVQRMFSTAFLPERKGRGLVVEIPKTRAARADAQALSGKKPVQLGKNQPPRGLW